MAHISLFETPLASPHREERARRRPAHPTNARHEGGQLRLTRRGRVVVVLATLGLLLIGGFTLGRVSASNAAGVPRTTVVQTGDTMWSIASHASPGRDPRAVIADIERINHVTAADLLPGVELTLPS
jgi:hypothetical protein